MYWDKVPGCRVLSCWEMLTDLLKGAPKCGLLFRLLYKTRTQYRQDRRPGAGVVHQH